MIILLDSGPLGLATNPKQNEDAASCQQWLRGLILQGHRALVPAIIDYEIRRELLIYGKMNGLARLDLLAETHGFLPLTDAVLRVAADLWAEVRRHGLPTADRFALDVDVILCAQAATFEHLAWQRLPTEPVVIATTNVGHLSRFADARLWQDIP